MCVCLSVHGGPIWQLPMMLVLTYRDLPILSPSLPYPTLYREPEPQHPFCTRTSGDQTYSFEDTPGADIYGGYCSMYVWQGGRTHPTGMLSSCYNIFNLNTIELFPNSLFLDIKFVG